MQEKVRCLLCSFVKKLHVPALTVGFLQNSVIHRFFVQEKALSTAKMHAESLNMILVKEYR